MNNYARLHETKRDVPGVGATPSGTLDPEYMTMIEAVSREIEGPKYCNRKFHTTTETRYFDGNGCNQLYFQDYSDLLSVTTLKVDEDGDGVYETTLTANTDYWLWPDNRTPKRRLDLNPESSTLGVFPAGRRRIQLVGKFGYSDLTESAGTLGEALDASETEITMTTGHTVYPGDTMIVGSEEMYVSAVSVNTLTVTRGINGTTAASADTAAAVSIRRYPADIEEAVRIRVADQRWGNSGGNPMGEMGRGNNEFAKFMGLVSNHRMASF